MTSKLFLVLFALLFISFTYVDAALQMRCSNSATTRGCGGRKVRVLDKTFYSL